MKMTSTQDVKTSVTGLQSALWSSSKYVTHRFKQLPYLKGIYTRAKITQIQQKLERLQRLLQRNSKPSSIPHQDQSHQWTHCRTNKNPLPPYKNHRSNFSPYQIHAIFTLSCKHHFINRSMKGPNKWLIQLENYNWQKHTFSISSNSRKSILMSIVYLTEFRLIKTPVIGKDKTAELVIPETRQIQWEP